MVRHTKTEAQVTRMRIVEGALAAFAESGVRTTTLEHVAERAGVTRGAVYWHFADKVALVSEATAGLAWPLDVGADMDLYRAHPLPLQLLCRKLWRQMEQCVSAPIHWQKVKLVLAHDLRSELSPSALKQLEKVMASAAGHLGQVMTIARERGQLLDGLCPLAAGQGLHAIGKGMLWAHASDVSDAPRLASPLCLELFMAGAAHHRADRSLPGELGCCRRRATAPPSSSSTC